MKIDAKDQAAREIQLVDEAGSVVSYCKSFDTETKEAELYIVATKTYNRMLVNNGQPVIVKITLPKARLIHRKTKQEVK